MPQAAAVARCLLRKLHISRIRSCSPVPPDRSGTATHSPALPWQLGQTALHCAAGYGALPIVKALIDGGADKSITDMDGNTPCELAKNYGACSPPALLPPLSGVLFPCVAPTSTACFGHSGQTEVVNMLS